MLIGIAPKHHEIFDEWLKTPDAGAAQPIVTIIPIQILAYEPAVQREGSGYAEEPRKKASPKITWFVETHVACVCDL